MTSRTFAPGVTNFAEQLRAWGVARAAFELAVADVAGAFSRARAAGQLDEQARQRLLRRTRPALVGSELLSRWLRALLTQAGDLSALAAAVDFLGRTQLMLVLPGGPR